MLRGNYGGTCMCMYVSEMTPMLYSYLESKIRIYTRSFLPQADHSAEGRFLLPGFSDWPALQPVLLARVLLCYLLSLAGSSTLTLLAVRDPSLHTPTCYLLCHLALVDAGFTTSVAPALLASLCGAELRLQRAGCPPSCAHGLRWARWSARRRR
ncbi:hypothetical protein GH733_017787 [Mirounga leonina]|nr:hypothetical protein GH733_017787 [Mirounga leonina]